MKKFIGLLLCLALMTSACAFASTIETTGTASVSLSPDTAKLTLGIRAFVSDVSEAMSNVNGRVATIRDALTKLGVADDDMVAADVYIYNNYDYETGANTGYNVSRQMQITVRDITAVGGIIDAALASGADELNGLTFTSSKQREAYDEALKLAVEDARNRAFTIAYAQGVSVKCIQSVKENDIWTGTIFEAKGASDAAAMTSTELDVGSLNIQASVTAVYEAIETVVE